jgi:hypothetical protein
MILDIETTKFFLTISIFILMGFSLLVSIRYGKLNKWTYIMIPVILALSVTVKISIEDMLGYPTKREITTEQLYLTHMVGINKEWIYIWAIDKQVSMVPRSYRIDYTKENEKQLNDAKNQASSGVPIGVIVDTPPTSLGEENSQHRVRVNIFNKFTGVTKQIQLPDADN